MSEATNEATAALEWDLADRMRKALRVGNLGVQEMADELQVDRNTVGRYINGRSVPRRATLVVWALRCGVPVTWLETGEVPAGNGSDPTGGGAGHSTRGTTRG